MGTKILIVDDEPSVIKLVDTLLESFGYISEFIPKADYLLKTLEEDNFDLILMDINMPGIDGIAALKKLKNTRHKNIPVIMMTADTNEQTLENCFNSGASDYITKPIQELVLKSRVKSVVEKQQHLAEIEKQRKNILDSIDYAKTIQNALLPKPESFKEFFSGVFVYFKPRNIVSGDFYMINKINQQIIIVAADCTGHGVPGAFMSLLGMSFINEIIRNSEILKANEILNSLREYVKSALQQKDSNCDDGMDMALVIINIETLQGQFSGANRPLIWFKNESPNNLIEIDGDAMPVSIFPKEHSFTNNEIQFSKNDTIYLFSDGYIDQFGGQVGESLNTKAFYTLLIEMQNVALAKQSIVVDENLIKWQGINIQTDDILIMGIKI